jgi:rhodanese-related sulfurtransferase
MRLLLYFSGSLLVLLAFLWWRCDHVWGVRWAQRVVSDRFPDVPTIPPSELQTWLADPAREKPILLDVRTDEECAVSQLPGSLRAQSADEALDLMEPDRPVVVYCAAGYRAAKLARELIASGRNDVFNLDGGIFAWGNEDLPLERDGLPVTFVHPYQSFFSRLVKNPSTYPE